MLEHNVPVGMQRGPWLQGFVARYETAYKPPSKTLRGRLCVVTLRSGEITVVPRSPSENYVQPQCCLPE